MQLEKLPITKGTIAEKIFQYICMLLIIAKLGAILYFQVRNQESNQNTESQMFLLIETLNSQLQKIQAARGDIQKPGEKRQGRYSFKNSPHTKHVQRIENEAKMTLKDVTAHLMRDEGKRPEPYADNIGVAVGVGRNLTTYGIKTNELRAINPTFNINEHIDKINIGDKGIYIDDIETAKAILKTPLSDHHIALLLLSNLKDSADDLRNIFSDWDALDNPRKEATVDMHYNLGGPNFRQFKNFIVAMEDKNWVKASESVLLSLAAQQNPSRYQRIANVIKTGDRNHFENQ